MSDIEKYDIDNLCKCVCHIKGRKVLHCFPCCKRCYMKYLISDEKGNIVFDPETTITFEYNNKK